MNNCKTHMLSFKKIDAGKRKLLILLVLLIAAVTAFIWSNSVMEKEDSISFSGGVMEFIKGIIDPDNSVDVEVFHRFIRKAAHFTEFFVLGTLYMLLKRNIESSVKVSLIFLPSFATLFTAVCDEFIQQFTGRGTAVKDVMLDFAGAVCGIIITRLVLYMIDKAKNK